MSADLPSKEDQQLSHAAHCTPRVTLPLVLFAHDLVTPDNVGALFRLSDALGVSHIYLSGSSPVPPNTKLTRVARSTDKYVPWTLVDNPLVQLSALKEAGYTIVSLEITAQSIDIAEFSVSSDSAICLLLGTEKHGISPELLSQSDAVVHIPMCGVNSSMNVASACSIAVYTLAQRLTPADHGV